MRRNLVIFYVLVAVLCAACKGTATAAGTAAPSSATAVPGTPLPGKASVVGHASALDTGAPLANIVVRLAPVLHLSPDGSNDTFVLDDANSPGTYANADGYFSFVNVDPKDYVIIVGDVNVHYAVATAAPDKAKVWQLSAGTITDVGEIRVILK